MPINRRHRPASQPHSLSHTTRERTRQGNHRLRELHRPLRQRLRPLPPLPLHLPLPPNLVELEAGEARELRLTVSVPRHISRTAMTPMRRVGRTLFSLRIMLHMSFRPPRSVQASK